MDQIFHPLWTLLYMRTEYKFTRYLPVLNHVRFSDHLTTYQFTKEVVQQLGVSMWLRVIDQSFD